jgi:soluble lytic murein transglycosylase-like protein
VSISGIVPSKWLQFSFVLAMTALSCGCMGNLSEPSRAPFVATAQLRRARNMVLSWPSVPDADALAGATLLHDGSNVRSPSLAIARSVLRDNPRITPAAALLLAVVTENAARRRALPPEFLAATLLQESAFDVEALSAAGAIGIAQFEPETAAGEGVDPFDPFDAIDGAAKLLAEYVSQYRGVYDDPYSAALAAYNAGPAAVARYHGVPPYSETREYVALIFDRWGAIVTYETIGREAVAPRKWKRRAL